MQKYRVCLFFIVCPCFLFSQIDSSRKYGTIKIAMHLVDSIYIRAKVQFSRFQEGNKNAAQTLNIPTNRIIPPVPEIKGFGIPFDYGKFFNGIVKINDLGEKVSDTVCIQVKILDNGKVYYKDLTPSMMLKGVPAYYDKEKEAFKLDPVHLKCMNTLKQIQRWEPAYIEINVKDTYKRTTVIKRKKQSLSATGIITIVFSKTPFE